MKLTLTALKVLCKKSREYYKTKHTRRQWVRHTAQLYASNRHLLQGRTSSWKVGARP